MFEKVAEISLLYDFYGQLLTEKQSNVFVMYHEENLSLSEIAEELQVTRAAIHDNLKHAEKALNTYEEKLGLLEKFSKTRNIMSEAESKIEQLILDNQNNVTLKKELEEVKSIFMEMEE